MKHMTRTPLQKVDRVRLQAMLDKLAEEFGFRSVSPFADRHGAWESTVLRSENNVNKFLSLICDFSAPHGALTCRFAITVAWEGDSLERELEAFALYGTESDGIELRSQFKRAIQAAYMAVHQGAGSQASGLHAPAPLHQPELVR